LLGGTNEGLASTNVRERMDVGESVDAVEMVVDVAGWAIDTNP
jgi:hypothetical protein